MRILQVADQLRRYTPIKPNTPHEGPRLSTIGLDFMDLCSTAVEKVSKTRWFDTGARFMVQAVLEEQRGGSQPPEDLSELCAWMPGDPIRDSKWVSIRKNYASKLPMPGDTTTAQPPIQLISFSEFRIAVMTFLLDLMTTLDPPILVQLERGKLGNLSREETQSLKERVGLR